MKKKRFNKKSIHGILKSFHAKRRQKERNITDAQLESILQNGELDERSEHQNIITLDGYYIYLNHDFDTIITVTAPEIQTKSPKLLSSDQGKKFIKNIQDLEIKQKIDEKSDLNFDDYMKLNEYQKKK